MKFLVFAGALLSFIVIGYADKAGWLMSPMGIGGKRQEPILMRNDSGKSKSGKSAKQSCTRSDDPAMPSTYPKTCVKGPPDKGSALLVDTCTRRGQNKQRKGTPNNRYARWRRLCIDQALSSGYADLAKSLAQESFIVVWPQGYDKMWGTCGADCDKTQQEQDKKSSGKKVHSVDDVTFLSSMISFIIQSDSSNNPVMAS